MELWLADCGGKWYAARSLVPLLTEVMAGKPADSLVFTTWRGKPLRNLNFRRDVFDPAARDAASRV